MKPWHRSYGMTKRGASLADAALPHAETLVRVCGDEILARVVFDEACFRVNQLPKRSSEFQKKYTKENIEPKSRKRAK